MRGRTNVRAWIRVAGVAALSAALVWSPAAPALGAPAIRAKLVVGNLNVPTAFTFGPGNRIWYVEKATGQVRVHDLPDRHRVLPGLRPRLAEQWQVVLRRLQHRCDQGRHAEPKTNRCDRATDRVHASVRRPVDGGRAERGPVLQRLRRDFQARAVLTATSLRALPPRRGRRYPE